MNYEYKNYIAQQMGNCFSSTTELPLKSQQQHKQQKIDVYIQVPSQQEENDDVREQKIIHKQELFQIQGEKLNKLLHRSIGALISLNKKKQLEIGSAFLISKNVILTAAHNVYNREDRCQNQSFKFYLEKNGLGKEYYKVKAVRYPQQFKTCPKTNKLPFDFALLKLEKQVGFDEFLQLSLPCQICLAKNKEIYLDVFGYPTYKANYEQLDQRGINFKLYQYGLGRNNRIMIIDPSRNKICYAISTLPGQSGCPIVVGQNVIAIHNGGGKKKEQFNVARLIDIPMLSTLEGWQQQLKADYFRINDKDLCPHTQPRVLKYLKNDEKQINLSKRGLWKIDISGKKYLLNLDLRENQLSAIDITKNTNLTQLNLRENQLSAINVTNNINLTQLKLSLNKLSSIDVTKNINLTQLDLSNNQLSAIDVAKNINLAELQLSLNQLSVIDLMNNINLNQLWLSWNNFSTIDVTKNINLTQLKISSNQLSAIDVTKNINLAQLDLRNNKLSIIDVSKNINLAQLNLSQNQFSNIYVSKNINLTQLDLSQNKLSAINVTKNINLTQLNLWTNHLSAIDITKNTKLSQLYLDNNKLSEVSLSFSSKLKQFSFDHQSSASCKVQISYDQIDSKVCMQWKEQQAKEYQKGSKSKHGCSYVLTVVKRD